MSDGDGSGAGDETKRDETKRNKTELDAVGRVVIHDTSSAEIQGIRGIQGQYSAPEVFPETGNGTVGIWSLEPEWMGVMDEQMGIMGPRWTGVRVSRMRMRMRMGSRTRAVRGAGAGG